MSSLVRAFLEPLSTRRTSARRATTMVSPLPSPEYVASTSTVSPGSSMPSRATRARRESTAASSRRRRRPRQRRCLARGLLPRGARGRLDRRRLSASVNACDAKPSGRSTAARTRSAAAQLRPSGHLVRDDDVVRVDFCAAPRAATKTPSAASAIKKPPVDRSTARQAPAAHDRTAPQSPSRCHPPRRDRHPAQTALRRYSTTYGGRGSQPLETQLSSREA